MNNLFIKISFFSFLCLSLGFTVSSEQKKKCTQYVWLRFVGTSYSSSTVQNTQSWTEDVFYENSHCPSGNDLACAIEIDENYLIGDPPYRKPNPEYVTIATSNSLFGAYVRIVGSQGINYIRNKVSDD